MKRLIVSLLLLVSLLPMGAGGTRETGSAPKVSPEPSQPKAKYIFFFIGDGMGLPQINAAEAYLMAREQKDAPLRLSFTTFPATGMATTYSSDSYITDSAAAGTALAAGRKTANGVINMDPGKTRTFTTIAERLYERGLKVGIISTVSIDHATPASFYAHQPSRSNYYEIGLELAKSGFEFFGGGGFRDPEGKRSKREGGKPNVLEEARKAGYTILTTEEEILGLSPGSAQKVIAINPVLPSSAAMPYKIDRDEESLDLADFTRKAVEFLENPEGFFIMVEGGKIDWACHANDAVAAIQDVLDFDEAVQVAVEFARRHPDETLIVVTGDHETGGLTIGFAGTRYENAFPVLLNQKVSFEGFNAVFESYKSKKGLTLDDVMPLVREYFGIESLTPYEEEVLSRALRASLEGVPEDDPQSYLLYGGYEPFTVTLTHVVNNRAGLGWTTWSHTGVPVPVYATGPGAHLFTGYYDNTDIPKRIARLAGVDL
ncbi:Alkaline phosphatase [Spirochaeta thermophila DSM 6578]|uniref:Alkaline phosphatase n=1 Tax=Winmispira thermophila (strain ATCC 700085 / DSM 6578 / Z-1203) TaxID=869211 RepID=G0GFB7_WINT7|nr:alkaline phosphatase [Spirochaeta thermophila]AEJ61531.1 Alkaline phosphatase [Spirochaeta thermophila DSM 6578]